MNRTLCAVLVMVYHQGVPWLKKGWTTLPYHNQLANEQHVLWIVVI